MSDTVRAGRPEDLDAVVAFNALMAWETEERRLDQAVLREGVAAVLGDAERGRYFLVEDGGEVVGQLMLTREWSDWRNGWFWWIQSVHVAESHRRRGIFRRLYCHVREAAKAADDVIGLRLYVEHDNGVAQSVYAAMGMVRTPYQMWEEDWSSAR